MSKKDYIKIAYIIKDNSFNGCPLEQNEPYEEIDRQRLIGDLCSMFKQDNKLFNKQRFIDACQ